MAIEQRLIPVIPLHDKALALNPDLISSAFPASSDVPIAAVCFQDATNVLCDCRIALHECHAHGAYYRRHKNPPEEVTAILMERFFLDDLAQRLYAAAEHLANAARFMLGVTDVDLKPYKKNRVSRQSIVGQYLINKQSSHALTQAIQKLATSRDWQLSMHYRGRWVHEQPLSIAGLGIWHKRQSRWRRDTSTGKMMLALGSGDKADYSIDQVREFLERGFTCLVQAAGECIAVYEEELLKRGLRVDGYEPSNSSPERVGG